MPNVFGIFSPGLKKIYSGFKTTFQSLSLVKNQDQGTVLNSIRKLKVYLKASFSKKNLMITKNIIHTTDFLGLIKIMLLLKFQVFSDFCPKFQVYFSKFVKFSFF